MWNPLAALWCCRRADVRAQRRRRAIHVKHQTPPAELVSQLFPSGSHPIHMYAEMLAEDGVTRGLLGPREIPRLWSRHILNCAVVAPLFRAGTTVADVGSGAGLPGLVLALARPDLRVTLIEPLLRRTTFLTAVVDRLGLPVEVIRARAEALHERRQFDYVTARAVAPLTLLVTWTLPLCAEDGEVVAWKGSLADEELKAARSVLHRHRAGPVQIHQYGAGVVTPPTRVVRIKSA